MTVRKNVLKYIYLILFIFFLFSIYQVINPPQTDTNIIAASKYYSTIDTLDILVSPHITTVSPFDAIFADDVFLINQVYQGLVKLDIHSLEVPDISKYWTVESNNTRYTFYLKANQLFHNGDTVRADDVIASLEYFLRHKTDSYIRPYFKVLQGIDEFWAGEASHIAGIQKTSPLAVTFLLKHPYIPFLKLLSLPEAKIMPASILSRPGIDLNDYPIGSGPYMVKGKTDSTVLLEAYQWPQRRDSLVGVKFFKIWLENNSTLKRIENRNFDISFSHVREFSDTTGQFDKFQIPSLTLNFVGINCQRYPTNNTALRKALQLGLNQDEVRMDYGSLSNHVNFYCPLNLPRDIEASPVLKYDLEKAETFLNIAADELNSKGRIKLSIAVDSSLTSSTIYSVVLKNLDSLGINYDLEYYSGLGLEEEAKFLSNYNLFLFGWYMDVPDPEFFFDVLFNSHQSINFMKYSNPTVDSMLEESYSNSHLDERLRTYVKIEKLLTDDAPIVPLMNDFDTVIYNVSLENVVLNRLGIVGLELSKIRLNDEYLAQKRNAQKRS
jgi:peptide/nickel transport system substrate-binding protein